MSKGARPNTVRDINTSLKCCQVSPTHDKVENRNEEVGACDVDTPHGMHVRTFINLGYHMWYE
jgi:hypothetical protein